MRIPPLFRSIALFVVVCSLFGAALPALAQSRRASDIVNVRNYGAVGDGVTDDYDAFVTALERVAPNGGTLYIASGDYLLSDSLSIERGNIDIVCGNNARLIVGGAGVTLLAFRGNLATGGRAANVRVEGCKFYDPDPLAHVAIEESHGIVLTRIDHAVLERLQFVDIGDESIDVIHSTDVRILNNYVRGGCSAVSTPHAGSISLNSSSRIQVRGNVVENQTNGSGIRIEVHAAGTRADHIIIADNQIFDSGDAAALRFTSGSAIVAVPASNPASMLSITGNQIVNPYRYGVFIHPVFGGEASNLIVSGNSIVGGGHGIEDNSSPNHGAIAILLRTSVGAVVGNVVQDWGNGKANLAGIRLIGDRLAVVANTVVGVPGTPIRDTHSTGLDNVILGNLVIAPEAAFASSAPLPSCRMAATANEGDVDCRP